MKRSSSTVDVYLEAGKKRTFAAAIDWPGWARAGRNEESALQALLESGPRYAAVLQAAGIAFQAPTGVSALVVTQRLDGTATTDFGAPDVMPASDAQPFGDADFERCAALLQAYWQALDRAVETATGKELRKGPRGGGRDLDKIVEHVLGAERSYLGQLAWKPEKSESGDLGGQLHDLRREEQQALERAARGEMPERGPRGGKLWTPRYFVRRAGWHVLDHAWEIEDRIE